MRFDPISSPYTFIHTPRNRNTYISITHEGEVVVKSPLQSEPRIRRMLQEKEEWIAKKLTWFQSKTVLSHDLGKTIRFRGVLHPIENVSILYTKLMGCTDKIKIEKNYHDFYRHEAELTIPGRVRYYALKMGLSPSEIRFKRLRRRWGSCDSKGVITFNTLVMQLSYEHIDYIIVHELAHLRHMNHSAAFHALIREYLSNERQLRREIKGLVL